MKILLVDDDRNLAQVLKNELVDEGFDVDQTGSGAEAMERLGRTEYDVIILDLNMPSVGGMEILKNLKFLEIPTEVIILTGHGTVAAAVEAMKLGAHDFLTKPFDVQELIAAAKKAFEHKMLVSENLHLKAQIQRQAESQPILTRNPRMLEILESVKRVALSEIPVLVQGESGVGKELVARAVHEASGRKDGPFIPINCGAIPGSMMESELFGHEKGSFTDAHARKLGLLEIADRGTLFLDEIGELPPLLQVKLLRVIETGRFFRVGGVKDVRVDVKFLSATNKDLKKEVGKGNFRADLYYRISGLTLEVPPLRERKEDIPLLVEHLIRNNPGFKGKGFSPGAWKILSEYDWPGNVRELQNVVHRALLLSHTALIEAQDLPADLRGNHRLSSRRLEDMERGHILKVLKDTGGQKGKAAEILGLDPKTLYRKLLTYQDRGEESPLGGNDHE